MKKQSIIIFSMLFLLTGCIGGSSQQTVADSGVYKSVNQGQTWTRLGLVANVEGRQMSLFNVNNAVFIQDPNDPEAFYYGTIGNGLIYTYDGGATWYQVKDLANATIRGIAVAPDAKCRIYAAVNNRVYRSEDCNRSYEQVYYDNEVAATVDAVAIDHYDSNVIYIGITRGNQSDLVKSFDQGESWQTTHRFRGQVKKIVVDPNDSRRLYAATEKQGLLFSADAGENWTDWNEPLKENGLGLQVRDVIVTPGEDSRIFVATTYGMLRSADQGGTWEKIELIPPENKATINAMAVNPQNTEEIYYVTYTTFYRSIDGGANWSPAKLPTSRAGWKLLVDAEDPKTLFMTVRAFES